MIFSHQMIQFFLMAWKHGERNDYSFCSLFTDNIFRGDGSVGMGVCGWEHGISLIGA